MSVSLQILILPTLPSFLKVFALGQVNTLTHSESDKGRGQILDCGRSVHVKESYTYLLIPSSSCKSQPQRQNF